VPHAPLNPAVQSISAFLPCFNDEATIASMVSALVKTLETVGVDSDVIVVNDGSDDASHEVLEDLANTEPSLRIVVHERNRGYGGALLSGFAAATGQWVFYTDGDGQYDPAELAVLVEHASDDVDVVQGYKVRRADNTARRVIGRVYHWFVSALFGLRIRDVDCDFRLIRRSLLERVPLTQTSGAICVEMVCQFQRAGARFVEVPVHHGNRQHGKSRFFRLGSVVLSLWDLAALWVRLVVLRRRTRTSQEESGP
jgi:glycosyltransferase involved in cell wall biosynthesis